MVQFNTLKEFAEKVGNISAHLLSSKIIKDYRFSSIFSLSETETLETSACLCCHLRGRSGSPGRQAAQALSPARLLRNRFGSTPNRRRRRPRSTSPPRSAGALAPSRSAAIDPGAPGRRHEAKPRAARLCQAIYHHISISFTSLKAGGQLAALLQLLTSLLF